MHNVSTEMQLWTYFLEVTIMVTFFWYHMPLVNWKAWNEVWQLRKDLPGRTDLEPEGATRFEILIFHREKEKEEAAKVWTVEQLDPPPQAQAAASPTKDPSHPTNRWRSKPATTDRGRNKPV